MGMVDAAGYRARASSTRGTTALRIVIYGCLIAGAVVMLFPLFWMISTSLKLLPATRQYPPIWFPLPPQWGNYAEALRFQPFVRYILNSFIIAVPVVIGDAIVSAFVAYGFARLRFPGRDAIFMVLVSTMMIPFIVRLVPLFLIFQRLGWINTYWPLIVPPLFGTPFHIFLLRQFYRTLPPDLAEAARLDGANEFGIWWRIYLPLSKPALATVALFAFQQSWNDFLAPLIFLNDNHKYTAALGLANMLGQSGASTQYWNLLMASATMTVVPMIVLFVVFQRYFVRGIALSGVKG
jgi:ABC-type glycerol-3-phosphate transport system permease component